MKRKQFLAFMLTAAMGISVIAPVSAFAADDEFAAAVEASFAVPEMSDRPYARFVSFCIVLFYSWYADVERN